MPALILTIGKNTGLLFLVNLAGAGFGFLMAVALGRGLGDAGFGRYSFVMTWLLGLQLVTEFGISTALTRNLAARPHRTHQDLIHSLAAKSLLSLPAILGLLLLAPAITPQKDPAVMAALRWGAAVLYTGLVYSSFTAVFKAHQIMAPILWLTIFGQAILFAGTLALLLARQPLFVLVAWAGFSQGLQCLLALRLYQTASLPAGSRRGALKMRAVKTLLRGAWPFALAGILAALQLRANILLLGYLQNSQALGWYAAANRFAETGRQLPGAFYAAALPAMAALAATQHPARQKILQKTVIRARLALLAFAGLAAAGGLLLAGPVLFITYGPAYRPAALTLQLLGLTLIPATQNSLLITYLYARGKEKFVNGIMALGIAANLSLCVWLVPRWGPAGTALSLMLVEIMVYFPYRWKLGAWRHTD